MTQGGPLQSTVSVLYFMYEEGFKWWNLGNASAVAFILFLLMFAVTALLGCARRRGMHMKRASPAIVVNGALVALAAAEPVSAVVDGVGVAHAARRGQHVSAAALPRDADAGQLPRAVCCARGMTRYLVNSLLLATAVTALSLAVQHARRLCVRQVALRGPRAHLPRDAGGAGDSVAGGDDAAVPAAQADGAGQHVRGRRSCRRWRAYSASSSCGNTRSRFPTNCSTPRASTAPASFASSARSCCRR